jgi:DNA primase
MSAIDEIKQRIDIVDLIGETVRLQRAGRNFKGLCPFHTEKTPSFIVSPDRQSWHCFGACGTGGDVIAFVMKRDGVDFREALETLARRAGVALSDVRRPELTEQRDRLIEANEAAALFFHHALREASEAEPARRYLERRGLDAATVERFQLGFAPGSYEALTTYLRSRGFSDQEMLDAGLASPGDHGPYDRFRARLMFPIRNERGRVAGFGGRSLPELEDPSRAGPKYLNTPQTPLFDKGGLLYALDLAREGIRVAGKAVIVEGYMDAIAAHQHGFTNVVATMGTALTERQVSLLKRFTRNLVVALDADAAGSEATLRGIEVIAGAVDQEAVPVPTWQGLIRHQHRLAADIRVAALPEGRDPDDVIRSDPALWSRLVDEARPVLDHLYDVTVARARACPPVERFKIIEEFLPTVAAIPDPLLQAQYLDRLLLDAGLSAPDRDELRRALRRTARPRTPAERAGWPTAAAADPEAAREAFCLALLFRYPALRERGLRISPEFFHLAEHRALFLAWTQEPDAGVLAERLQSELRERLETILARRIPPLDERRQLDALESCVWHLEQERLRAWKRETALAVADLEERNSPSRLVESTTAAAGGPTDTEEPAPADVVRQDTEAGLLLHRRVLEWKRNVQS